MEKKVINVDFVVDNPNLYRIAWKSRTTNFYGCGMYACTKEDALNSVRELNKIYPDSHHWVEQNPRLN
ncbi:hypothetical protein QNI19_05545 [Cytophagaceae bacterium DM2B3-1]|uniref:Uncharacterized protein n=1 Tax=Xanthocytophaga flava TaxID=3048013 RepID=A0AAE3U8E8_9BACT|nr:hypothetical protein [Xanthocytophaga flavus]MDJ1472938.1 hypothetical protein [Xanthocytophaga flavus]MDJ1483944.1 hypothetical protein [Xanthocytophaga flavus]MDJ1492383.1 hypothetical protein [Xanthocytophaga flavus]